MIPSVGSRDGVLEQRALVFVFSDRDPERDGLFVHRP
jgi:hypothetical protein